MFSVSCGNTYTFCINIQLEIVISHAQVILDVFVFVMSCAYVHPCMCCWCVFEILPVYENVNVCVRGYHHVYIDVYVQFMFCERGVIGQSAKLLMERSAQGMLLRTDPHRWWSEVEDGRDKWRVWREGRREITHTTRRMTHGWYDAHKNLSQCCVRRH